MAICSHCLLSICNFLFISHFGFKSGIWLFQFLFIAFLLLLAMFQQLLIVGGGGGGVYTVSLACSQFLVEGYFLSVFHKYISSAEEEIKCVFDDN